MADAGINVRVLDDTAGGMECDSSSYDYGEMDAAIAECRDLIRYFVKRISPRPPGLVVRRRH